MGVAPELDEGDLVRLLALVAQPDEILARLQGRTESLTPMLGDVMRIERSQFIEPA